MEWLEMLEVAVRNVRQAAMKKIKGLKSDLSEDVVGSLGGFMVDGFWVDDFLSTNPSLCTIVTIWLCQT